MKVAITTTIGVVGGFISYLFGGWTASITTLLILMIIDYVSGLIVAGVFHKSPKSETGSLESKAGWKGLCRKFITLVFVIVANRIDMEMGTTFIRDAVCISFIVNELISLIENAGLMGVPIPKVIKNAIDVLNKKANGDE